MKQNRTFSLSFFGIITSNAMYPKASLGRIENDVGPNSKSVIFYMVLKTPSKYLCFVFIFMYIDIHEKK